MSKKRRPGSRADERRGRAAGRARGDSDDKVGADDDVDELDADEVLDEESSDDEIPDEDAFDDDQTGAWVDVTDEIRAGGSGHGEARPREKRIAGKVSRIEVLFRDEMIAVVNKPAGLPVEPCGDERGSVLEQLGVESAFVPMALDDDASGVVVVGLTKESGAALKEQLREGRFVATTLALVLASRPDESGSIELRMQPADAQGRKARLDSKHGAAARTDWRLRDAFAGHALLECQPRTGMRHQVRAHLQAAGMPLAVDPVYGGGSEVRLSSFKPGYRPSRRHGERPLIARLTLHAAEVALVHPRNGAPLRYSALPPKDFRAAIAQLAKYGRLA